ncbi:amidase signature enzyme [Fomitopsis serialis]|uniref:amidase signature enzyme n=1 Tax=Fomitopsis serialis TaxID=139415 RepID=UPI002008CEF2|nr:amidase signature enzyme [Neoantrodia serialis]KAH9912038.1 amidase signature enzyme [Neoantrodia serialis]
MRAWFLACFLALVTLQAAVLAARLSARSLLPEKRIAIRESLPDLYEASVVELQVLHAYFARIEEVNLQGPILRAVIETNPSALAQAAALDAERLETGPRSLLHGIPVLVKDNMLRLPPRICRMNTTAGSYSLLGSVVPAEAVRPFPRQPGSGWSGRGGQCTNAYFPHADPVLWFVCGLCVAASIGLAAVTLGTETDGSITCPANQNNLAGIKPSVGLTSRAGVIPISEHQDTVGPLTRSMADAAIAGPERQLHARSAVPRPDYTLALDRNAFAGKRIGVPRAVFLNDSITGNDPYVNEVFEAALEVMKALGATVVDPADLPSAEAIATSNNESTVLDTDFKIQLNAWYEGLLSNPSGVRSLAELIAFDNANPTLEEPARYTDQSELIASEATTGFNSTYYAALAYDYEMGRTNGIDAALEMYDLDALVLPAPGFTTVPAAIAGYPIVTVPLGFYPDNITIGLAGPETVYPAPGVPIGLSFLGTAWSEFDLVSYAYAYEQHTHTRLARKAYAEAIPTTQLWDVIYGA